jgi:cysteine synthase A
MLFDDNSLSIGGTPLVKLGRLAAGAKATVLAKIEGRNPGYSVKDRIGASMIKDAETRGVLKPGVEVVEPTSGNTGIALAYVCAARGYKLTLTMPETMSIERRRVLAAFGANLVLTPGPEGMPGAIRRAEALAAGEPGRYFLPQQFKNPANPRVHEETTGPEIWNDTNGKVDVLVSGVGTGGTITGVARYFEKVKKQPLYSVAVEPVKSPVITQSKNNQPLKPGPHKIQGIGAGFIPETLDMSVVDRVEQVADEEAIETARRLAREEGVLSGISCGAAAAVAVRLAKLDEFAGKTIVAIPVDRPVRGNLAAANPEPAGRSAPSVDLGHLRGQVRKNRAIAKMADDLNDGLPDTSRGRCGQGDCPRPCCGGGPQRGRPDAARRDSPPRRERRAAQRMGDLVRSVSRRDAAGAQVLPRAPRRGAAPGAGVGRRRSGARQGRRLSRRAGR